MGKSWRSDPFFTPPMECHWAKILGKARVREEGDEPTWSIDLVGDPNEPAIAELQKQIRAFMIEAHGAKPNVSRHGMPLKRQMEKNDDGEEVPTGMLVLKPKRVEQRKGSDIILNGPIVVDSQKQPWPQNKLIGNYSKVRCRLKFWAWDRGKEGVGISAELEAVQVIEYKPYEREEPADGGFDVVEGGAVAPVDDEFEPDDDFGKQLMDAAQEAEAEMPF